MIQIENQRPFSAAPKHPFYGSINVRSSKIHTITTVPHPPTNQIHVRVMEAPLEVNNRRQWMGISNRFPK